MIAQQTSASRPNRHEKQISAPTAAPPLDVQGALWRYRWAVVLPAILFGVIGFLVYVGSEETFRSSTRLMVESNRPPVLDALTGEVVGGVPDMEVLEAQLYSDTVATMAFNDVNMKNFRGLYDNDVQKFITEVKEQLELEPEVTDVKSAQSLIALLHFDSTDTDHCEAAIKAYSKALQDYYDQRHQTSQGELSRLIEVALKDVTPKLNKLEERYSDFRSTTELAWDKEGNAINPHRERYLFLEKRSSEQYEELRREQTILSSIETVAKSTEDPRIALSVMSQLLDVKVSAVTNRRELDPIAGDSLLAEIDLEKKLLPLIVEKNQVVAQFGPSHPTVRALDEELETTRNELLRLVREQADRITKIRTEWYEDMGDPVERAKEMVEAVVLSYKARVLMMNNLLKELKEQIATEKREALRLAQAERENEKFLREIEQNRELMRQLEENMGKTQLSEKEESVTQVTELKAPTEAYLVGPSLLKTAGVGVFLGLLMGGGLALLLEKNADTFRDPEEISSMLGVAILTHIPFFRGKKRRLKKGEVDPYKTMSADMAVIHQPSSIAAESVRSLRTNVFFDTAGIQGGKVIQITSPLPGDGKSTVASNLACSIAQSGKRVLVIDCDLRRPQLTDNFDVVDQTGLTNVLNGDCEPLDATHSTPIPKLSVMPCGPIPSNPAEALSLPVMAELLTYLREHFDYIILDTPPLLVVTDPSITASMADALILTLRIRRKSKPNAKEALNVLHGVGANVLGVVINNSDEAGSADGYKGYGYYRYNRNGGRYYRRGADGDATSVAVNGESVLRRSGGSASAGNEVRPNGSQTANVVRKSADPIVIDGPPVEGAVDAAQAQKRAKGRPSRKD